MFVKIGRFLKIFFSESALPKWTDIWWEAPMESSVLSFLKAEWKVSDTNGHQNIKTYNNTTQKTKKMSSMDPTKKPWVNSDVHEG
jgi:hypothetical protein